MRKPALPRSATTLGSISPVMSRRCDIQEVNGKSPLGDFPIVKRAPYVRTGCTSITNGANGWVSLVTEARISELAFIRSNSTGYTEALFS